MVSPEHHVTPNLPSLALTLLPPTGPSINLITRARGATLATDKWVSSTARARALRSCVCTRGNPRQGRALSPHHMAKVSI